MGTSTRPTVHGIDLTPLTQCAHWYSDLDVIAIKHKCCRKFYACAACHDALERHPSEAWSAGERGERAVLCGACGCVLTIDQYVTSGSRCTLEGTGEVGGCGRAFNPGCRLHWTLYFQV